MSNTGGLAVYSAAGGSSSGSALQRALTAGAGVTPMELPGIVRYYSAGPNQALGNYGPTGDISSVVPLVANGIAAAPLVKKTNFAALATGITGGPVGGFDLPLLNRIGKRGFVFPADTTTWIDNNKTWTIAAVFDVPTWQGNYQWYPADAVLMDLSAGGSIQFAISIANDYLQIQVWDGAKYYTINPMPGQLIGGQINTVVHSYNSATNTHTTWFNGYQSVTPQAAGNYPGLISVTAGSAIVTGNGSTKFPLSLAVGGCIKTAGGQFRKITAISSDNSLTVDQTFTTSEPNVTYNNEVPTQGAYNTLLSGEPYGGTFGGTAIHAIGIANAVWSNADCLNFYEYHLKAAGITGFANLYRFGSSLQASVPGDTSGKEDANDVGNRVPLGNTLREMVYRNPSNGHLVAGKNFAKFGWGALKYLEVMNGIPNWQRYFNAFTTSSLATKNHLTLFNICTNDVVPSGSNAGVVRTNLNELVNAMLATGRCDNSEFRISTEIARGDFTPGSAGRTCLKDININILLDYLPNGTPFTMQWYTGTGGGKTLQTSSHTATGAMYSNVIARGMTCQVVRYDNKPQYMVSIDEDTGFATTATFTFNGQTRTNVVVNGGDKVHPCFDGTKDMALIDINEAGAYSSR
jgi:hypothetical protein